MNIFAIKKGERLPSLLMTFVLLCFHALHIHHAFHMYTKAGKLGYYTIFSKNFCLSGYDPYTYIYLSNFRVHFITDRHPLLTALLYPFYKLNQWLMDVTDINFAVFIMAAIMLFCAVYAFIFLIRIFREVIEIPLNGSILLAFMTFSFAHVLVSAIAPDHFCLSFFMLTMTLWLTGKHMKEKTAMSPWQTGILLFFTAGIALSNGAKTILAALFANGKKFFRPVSLLVSMIIPLVFLFGAYQLNWHQVMIPQQKTIKKIEEAKRKNDPGFEKHIEERNKWLREHNGTPVEEEGVLKLTNISTPRLRSAIENFFGESIQLHQQYLLEDMSTTRPVFVPYDWWVNYIVEAIIFLLLIAGILTGMRTPFMRLCLSWFACDLFLHIVLGFAITEVYIMATGWIFIIPIAYAYLMKALTKEHRRILYVLLCMLTVYLWIYNGGLITKYLLG